MPTLTPLPLTIIMSVISSHPEHHLLRRIFTKLLRILGSGVQHLLMSSASPGLNKALIFRLR
eukprot:6131284-Karenia_brevis.AAC.1